MLCYPIYTEVINTSIRGEAADFGGFVGLGCLVVLCLFVSFRKKVMRLWWFINFQESEEFYFYKKMEHKSGIKKTFLNHTFHDP